MAVGKNVLAFVSKKLQSNFFNVIIIGKENIEINSLHSFCIPNTKLCISARSDDKVIEAVEDKRKTFFLGVQWHPELLNDENTDKLFTYFINKL